jgi:hypothetical protein
VSASQTIQFNYSKNENEVVPNYCNYKISPGKTKEDTVICIYNSYLFRNQHDMKRMLRYIINTNLGQECGLSEDDITYYVAEWVTHNFAYYYPEIASGFLNMPVEDIKVKSKNSELNLNDPYSDIYWTYYKAMYN